MVAEAGTVLFLKKKSNFTILDQLLHPIATNKDIIAVRNNHD